MKKIALLLLCSTWMSVGRAARVETQHADHPEYYDPRTPQGTLRAFAAALTKADLTQAATYIVDAKPAVNTSEIKQAMQKFRTDYSIQQLRIAINGDTATISFFLRVSQPPNLSSWISWAVLRQRVGGWYIEPVQTLAIANNTDTFSLFVSLLSGQRLPGEERDDSAMQGIKFLDLGTVVKSLVADKDGKFALQDAQMRQRLLPYCPTLDVLLRYPAGQSQKISFNNSLANAQLKKIRFPQRTVMLYEGENGLLDFRHNGRAIVTLVAGNVQYVDPMTALKLLLWSP